MLYILKQNKYSLNNLLTNSFFGGAENPSWKSDIQEKPENTITTNQDLNDLKSQVEKNSVELDLNKSTLEVTRETKQKALDFINMHEQLKDSNFYQALESWVNWWEIDGNVWLSDMWGALWILREIVWENRASEYYAQLSSMSNNISKNRELFNTELSKLLPREERANGLFRVVYTEREETFAKYLLRDLLIWLILKDIPLFDLWLHFSKGLVSSGIDMDSALAFQKWVETWMVWTPDYSEENLSKLSWDDLLQSMWHLRVLLIGTWLSKNKADAVLRWEIDWLTELQEKLIKTVLETRIIPDIENINKWWFNWLEKFFDDKDNKIEKILRELKWEKYNLDLKANGHDVILQQVGGNYILEVDDWWANTFKVFNRVPTEAEIESSIKNYEAGWEQEKNDGWQEKTTLTSNNSDVFWSNEDTQNYDALLLNDWKYLVRQFWKYKIFDSKPTQEQINNIDISSWRKTEWNLEINDKLSLSELLEWVDNAIKILREQDKEGRWFTGPEGDAELTSAIDRTEDRTEYLKSVNKEFDLIQGSLEMLRVNDAELYNRYSILWLFDSTEALVTAFPPSDSGVAWMLKYLNQFKNTNSYLDKLKEIGSENNVKEYFDNVNAFIAGDKQNIQKHLISSINPRKYNKEISMLSTLSFPITSNLLRSLAGKLSDGTSWWGGSSGQQWVISGQTWNNWISWGPSI